MGTAASRSQGRVVGYDEYGNQIRRGRTQPGWPLRGSDILEPVSNYIPDYPMLRQTSRATRNATQIQHLPRVRRAAHQAWTVTNRRVTDAQGRIRPDATWEEASAVWTSTLDRADQDAHRLRSTIERRWPRIAAETFLWAAETPGQSALEDRLLHVVADHAPVEIDYYSLPDRDGVSVANWTIKSDSYNWNLKYLSVVVRKIVASGRRDLVRTILRAVQRRQSADDTRSVFLPIYRLLNLALRPEDYRPHDGGFGFTYGRYPVMAELIKSCVRFMIQDDANTMTILTNMVNPPPDEDDADPDTIADRVRLNAFLFATDTS